MQFRRPLATSHPPSTATNQIQPFTVPSLPGVTFTVLHSASNPQSHNSECSYLINNASIVLKLQIGTTSFLFTGDANGKERAATDASQASHVEGALMRLEGTFPGALNVDVVKAPHHGSETASTTPFIRATNPDFVIISASTQHHLPRTSVVNRWAAPERVILRTDDDRSTNVDHILCVKETGVALDCNFESVFVE